MELWSCSAVIHDGSKYTLKTDSGYMSLQLGHVRTAASVIDQPPFDQGKGWWATYSTFVGISYLVAETNTMRTLNAMVVS